MDRVKYVLRVEAGSSVAGVRIGEDRALQVAELAV